MLFVAPLIMGHVGSVLQSLKTGYIFFDCAFIAFLLMLSYNRRFTHNLWQRIPSYRGKACRIFIAAQERATNLNNTERSVRFRALMHYMSTRNKHIYQLREVTEFECLRDLDDKLKEVSEYVVDQLNEFQLSATIFGRVSVSSKETHRDAAYTEIVDMRTLEIFSYKHNLDHLQAWIEDRVLDFKNYLRLKSNDQQLLITASLAPKKEGSANGGANTLKKKSPNGAQNSINLEVTRWQSTITFENSYFHGMEDILAKIDFFLQNKSWYEDRGIPYNLGILLTGKPGGGKTRFIKQLLNYTGRHAVDIKLHDQMDYTDLQHIIFREQLTEDLIIPQEQRLLIMEDIDAMGDTVKERVTADLNEPLPTALPPTATGPTVTPLPPNTNATAATNAFLMNEILKTQQKMNLSYLLNMLDGINECSGRILVMTTNRVEVLDKALIRPGRIDIKIHFQECTRYDVLRLMQQFWPDNDDLQDLTTKDLKPDVDGKYTPAELMNLFRCATSFTDIEADFIMK